MLKPHDFLYGQCHALAYAMRLKYGYPIIAITDEDDYVDHFVVQNENGELFDGGGWFDPDSFFDRPEMQWADGARGVDLLEFLRITSDSAWQEMKLAEAVKYVNTYVY